VHSDRVLIKGGIKVSKFGIGTATFGGLYSKVDFKDALAVVEEAVSLGINYFDTAPHYGLGLSELRLGEIFSTLSLKECVVSTKVGRLIIGAGTDSKSNSPIDEIFDFSPDGIRRSIEKSLDRLGFQKLDMVLIHDPDFYADQAIEEAFPTLIELKNEGLIGSIGLGMNQNAIPIRFVRETDIDFILIAGRFTLLDQSAGDELLPLALEKGVSIMAAGVFNSGVLADPYNHAYFNYKPASPGIVRKALLLKNFFENRGHTLQSAALQFPLTHPAVNSVIVGCRNVFELRKNVEDFNKKIEVEIWEEFLEYTTSKYFVNLGNLDA